MVLLAAEEPFVAVVGEDRLLDTCSHCFAQSSNIITCTGCELLSYCENGCWEQDQILHSAECAMFKDDLPTEEVRILLRLIRKAGREKDFVAFNERKLADLDSHVLEFKKLWKQDSKVEKTFTKLLGILEEELKNLGGAQGLISFFGKCKQNTMELIDNSDIFMPKRLGTGIYVGLSVHPQSCVPDCFITFNGKIASFRSQKKEKYSKDLTIASAFFEQPYYSRIETNSKCKCIRCDSFSLHTGMSDVSGKCYYCNDGYVLPIPSDDMPKCVICSRTAPYTLEELYAAIDKAKDFLVGASLKMEDPDEASEEEVLANLTSLYNTMQNILSPINLYLYCLAKCLEVNYYRSGEDDQKLKKYILAQRKAIEKYFPLDEQALYYLKISDLTRPRYEEGSIIERINWDEVIPAAETACKMAEEAFGSEHPLAIDSRYTLEYYEFHYELSQLPWKEDYRQDRMAKRYKSSDSP